MRVIFHRGCFRSSVGVTDNYILPGPGGYLAAGLQKIRVRIRGAVL